MGLEVLAVAVLVDPVVGDLVGTWVDRGVGVVAVSVDVDITIGSFALTVRLLVGVAGAVAVRVDAAGVVTGDVAAVLVDAVQAVVGGARVGGQG